MATTALIYRSPFLVKPYFINEFKKKGSMWKCGYHTGEDWSVDNSKVALVAIDYGKVLKVNACGTSYGNHIVLSTADGKCYLMAHMKSTPLVKVGQAVVPGQVVGYMGSTGNSTGPHLHIELLNARTWRYASPALVKPSKHIDFNDIGLKGDFVNVKKFKNTSDSRLDVYAETSLATRIGSLNPKEVVDCLAVDMYSDERRALVRYKIDKTSKLKTGYVDATKGVIS